MNLHFDFCFVLFCFCFDTYKLSMPRLESCLNIFLLKLKYIDTFQRAKVKCMVRDEIG